MTLLVLAVLAASPTALYIPEPYRKQLAPLPGWSPTLATLGRKLFKDKRLSADGKIACESCHDPARAFTDGRRRAIGMNGEVGIRNTPTLINRSIGTTQFWDGRSSTLEEQALMPLTSPVEMGRTLNDVIAFLGRTPEYVNAFREACGGPPTPERLGQALAAYERTLFSMDSPFDSFLRGDETALPPAARRGLSLFGRKAHCSDCHAGPNLSDEHFHNLGVEKNQPGRAAVTKDARDTGAYRTPTLREVALTAPYMHDGSLSTLREVIEFYDRGGDPNPNLDPKVKPLNLTDGEKSDLEAFLLALSGRVIEGVHFTDDATGTVMTRLPMRGADATDHTVVYVESVPEDTFVPQTHVVSMSQKDQRFTPAVLPIARGMLVDLTNDDWAEHNVFSRSVTKAFDLGVYPKDKRKLLAFDRLGPVELGCSIHPDMSAVILVLQNPFFTRPEADGAVTLKVPVGQQRIVVYRRGQPERSAVVTVKKDTTTTLKADAFGL
jgi:cytochrome c peroxidase